MLPIILRNPTYSFLSVLLPTGVLSLQFLSDIYFLNNWLLKLLRPIIFSSTERRRAISTRVRFAGSATPISCCVHSILNCPTIPSFFKKSVNSLDLYPLALSVLKRFILCPVSLLTLVLYILNAL